MKILMVIDTIKAGGKERRLLELLKKLVREGYQVALVVLSQEIRYPEFFDLPISIQQVSRRYRYDFTAIFSIYRLAKKFSPDIIHSWSSMSSVLALPAARILGIPFVNAMIADAPRHLPKKHQIRAQLTFPFSNYVLANSKAGLVAYDAPAGRSRYIHNGFDFSRVQEISKNEQVRRRFQVQTPYVIGMIGRFHGHKDYRTYLEAARKLLDIRDDVSFMAIGEGPELDNLRETYVPGSHGRLLFTGRLSDIESVIAIFDIGVLTTNLERHGEGISNAIMEYMALGKPSVATRGGGTAELVLHEETGFLIHEKDVDGLVQHIIYLLDNQEKAREMGEKARQRIMQYFSMDHMTRQYVQLYEQVETN
jgi:glycosyltransferase involved in cell wall biosynthesis